MIPNEHALAVATGHFPAEHDEAANGNGPPSNRERFGGGQDWR